MSAVTASSLIKLIRIVIRRFKFEELENAVLPVFPETSWDRIKIRLIKLHENFTTLNVVAIIEEVINDSELQERDLKERLIRLELIDISRHKRKVWYTHSVSGSNHTSRHLGALEIKQELKEQLAKLGAKKLEVDAVIFDGVMYICVKYTQSSRAKVSPNYFAFFLGQKYLFSSKKVPPQNCLRVIPNIMGYSKSKSLDLKGKDLMSLIRLLRVKEQGVLNSADIINGSKKYRDAEPIIKSTGIDYTQEKQRKNFTEKCFGKNPPMLETLVVKAPSCPISDPEIASKLSDNIQIGVEFRSRNIPAFLTILAERGIFLSPLPPYISNLMLMGRNTLTLEEKEEYQEL
ncbi:hypothetical protein KPH14_010580 [Odynerus spinipes]|uniref:Uncharacterized protein n=1 Tax=Odynerus spinipes TaxID=1348599 RepID=A0AAD9RU78_9HYME|nr:hypothetical protein KPH14_010580 [Odynerus spinipes]